MATNESEGSSTPDPGILDIPTGNLTTSFKVAKTDCDVHINQTHLSWDKPNRKDKTTFSHSVAVADVIAVTDASPSKSESSVSGFAIHHLIRNKNHTWKVATVNFYATDEANARIWKNRLKQQLDSAVAKQLRPQHIYVFINPGSGNSHGVHLYEKHGAPLFALAGIKTNVTVTERAEHAVDVLQECSLDGVDGLIAVGGDGTFNDVVTGALKRYMKEAGKDPNNPEEELVTCPIRVGIIPAGSANGMVKMATNTYDITTAILHIIMGNSTPINMISAYNDGLLLRYSTLSICFGFSGEVMNYSQENRHLGRKRYLKSVFNMSKFMKFYDFDIHYLPAIDISDVDSQDKPEPGEPEGWYKAPGPFVNLFIINVDLETCAPMNGSSTICLMTRPTTFGFMKMVYRYLKLSPNTCDFNFFKNIHVKGMKIVNGSPKEETGSEAETAPPVTNNLSIDGEIHKITNQETIVKFHGTNIKVFGTAPQIHQRQKEAQQIQSKGNLEPNMI